jgi:hypothetical protein
MKKKLLVAGVALLTTAAVTATVLTNSHRKPTKDTGKCTMKKATHCNRASNVACY